MPPPTPRTKMPWPPCAANCGNCWKRTPRCGRKCARLMQSEVVQRVLAEGGSQIRDVVQEAKGGPTTQEVQARQSSTVENVRQIRRR
jgi:hypothetical protein